MKNIISQRQAVKNRLILKGSLKSVELEAGFLRNRGYFRCLPVRQLGENYTQAWDRFWDIWEAQKAQLKDEGLSVKKEKGKWAIFYRDQLDRGIFLDYTYLYERLIP